jgi:hypothetical protein
MFPISLSTIAELGELLSRIETIIAAAGIGSFPVPGGQENFVPAQTLLVSLLAITEL